MIVSVDEQSRSPQGDSVFQPRNLQRFGWYAGLLCIAYGWVLLSLAQYAVGEDLHSHVVLIPFISAYLIYLERARWPKEYEMSLRWSAGLAIPGLAALGVALKLGSEAFSHNDFLALTVFSFLCFLAAGAFYFLGRKWMAALAFPVGFMIFTVPMPDAAVEALEHFLMAASADAADLFYQVAGLPYLRDGQVFQLPGITLRVAQECSGIRSSWVLFITSLLASYMFLRSPWRRTLLVAMVIPLGILRNGFRVLVLGWLCIRKGPQMIHSDIHHKGGPIFFALSLIPLFLMLWWLRKQESVSTPSNISDATG